MEMKFRKGLFIKIVLIALLFALLSTGVVQAILENNKLSGGNIVGGNVESFKISPDGKYSVFTGDLRLNDKGELFSVPTLGGERVRLSHNLPDGHFVDRFFISSDSQTIVYSTADGSWNNCGIYAVPVSGGSPIELDQALGSSNYSRIIVTGDNQNVIFTEDLSSGHSTVFSVSIAGGGRKAISDQIEGDIWFNVSPDHQHVVYLQTLTAGTSQLMQSNLEGNKVFLADGIIDNDFKISTEGSHVIYNKRHDSTFDYDELYSVPIGGGTSIKLNSPISIIGKVEDFQITPDSKYVIYQADERLIGKIDIFRSPIYSSTGKINLTESAVFPNTDPNKDVHTFCISPDSQWVVYDGDLLMDGRYDLFSVSINGGTNYRLNTGMIDGGDVQNYEIAPNSAGVVYRSDFQIENVYEIFIVLMDGSLSLRLNFELPPGGDVAEFKISGDSQVVVYLSDQEVNDIWNLYGVPSVGGIPIRLNPDLVMNGDVTEQFNFTPNNRGVLYIADQELDQVRELFITYDYQRVYMPLIIK